MNCPIVQSPAWRLHGPRQASAIPFTQLSGSSTTYLLDATRAAVVGLSSMRYGRHAWVEAVAWCSVEKGVTGQSGINSAHGFESLSLSYIASTKGGTASQNLDAASEKCDTGGALTGGRSGLADRSNVKPHAGPAFREPALTSFLINTLLVARHDLNRPVLRQGSPASACKLKTGSALPTGRCPAPLAGRGAATDGSPGAHSGELPIDQPRRAQAGVST